MKLAKAVQIGIVMCLHSQEILNAAYHVFNPETDLA